MQKKRSLFNCTNGVAMLEFGIILPFLLVMLYGALEISRYALMNQKLDKLSNAMSDFATQGSTICNSDIDNYVSTADQIMKPFPFSGTIIFSSVIHFGNGGLTCDGQHLSCISWQASRLGDDVSRIGHVNGVATLPSNYEVIPGQNVIATEVFLNYHPMLDFTAMLVPSLSDHKMYKIAVYKPRQRNLTVLCP